MKDNLIYVFYSINKILVLNTKEAGDIRILLVEPKNSEIWMKHFKWKTKKFNLNWFFEEKFLQFFLQLWDNFDKTVPIKGRPPLSWRPDRTCNKITEGIWIMKYKYIDRVRLNTSQKTLKVVTFMF